MLLNIKFVLILLSVCSFLPFERDWNNIIVVKEDYIYLFSDSIYKNDCISYQFWKDYNNEGYGGTDYFFHGKILNENVGKQKLSVFNNNWCFFTCDTVNSYELVESMLMLDFPKTAKNENYKHFVNAYEVFNNMHIESSVLDNSLDSLQIDLTLFSDNIKKRYPKSYLSFNDKLLCDNKLSVKRNMLKDFDDDYDLLVIMHRTESGEKLNDYSYLLDKKHNNFILNKNRFYHYDFATQNINEEVVEVELLNLNRDDKTVKIKFGDFTRIFNYYDKKTEVFIHNIFDAKK